MKPIIPFLLFSISLFSSSLIAQTNQKEIKMGAENVHGVHVTAPVVEKEETAHFILKVSDKGSPILTRYKRVIVTVTP